MHMSMRLEKMTLDGAKFTRTLREHLRVQMRSSVREALSETAEMVPVYSGQARGAIKNAHGHYGLLASWLRVAIPISPVKVRKNKNASTGGRQGKYWMRFEGNKLIFEYDITPDGIYPLDYFVDPGWGMDQNTFVWPNGRSSGPWKWTNAFMRVLSKEFTNRMNRNMPMVSDFIVKKYIDRG